MSNSSDTETVPLVAPVTDGKPPITPTAENLITVQQKEDPPSSSKSGIEPSERYLPEPVLPEDFPEIDKLLNQTATGYTLDKYTFNGQPVEKPHIAVVGRSESGLQEWHIPPNTAKKGKQVLGVTRSARMGPFGLVSRERQETFDPGTMVYFQNPQHNQFKDIGSIFPGPPNTINGTVCQRVLFNPMPGSSKLDPRAMSAVWIPIVMLYQVNSAPRCLLWPRKPKRFQNGWDLGDFKDANIGRKAWLYKGAPFVHRGMDIDEFAVWGDACKDNGELLVPFGHSSMFYINDLDMKNNDMRRKILTPLNAILTQIEDARLKEERASLLAANEAQRLFAAQGQATIDPIVALNLQQDQDLLEEEMRAADANARQGNGHSGSNVESITENGEKTEDKHEDQILESEETPVDEQIPQQKGKDETLPSTDDQELKDKLSTPEKPPNLDLLSPTVKVPSPQSFSPKLWSTNPSLQKKFATAYRDIQNRYKGQPITEKIFLTEIMRLTALTESTKEAVLESACKELKQLTNFFNTESRKFFQKADNNEEVMFEKLNSMTDLNILTQSEFVRLGALHAKLETVVGEKIEVEVTQSTSKHIDLPKTRTFFPDKQRPEIPNPASATLEAKITPLSSQTIPAAKQKEAKTVDDDIVVEYDKFEGNGKGSPLKGGKPPVLPPKSSTATTSPATPSSAAVAAQLVLQKLQLKTSSPKGSKEPKSSEGVQAVVEQEPVLERMDAIPQERNISEDTDELNEKRWEMERSKNPLAVFLADPEGSYFAYLLKDSEVRTSILNWIAVTKGRKTKLRDDYISALSSEARKLPKGDWDGLGWDTLAYFRTGFPAFRVLQAGSARSSPITEKEDLQVIFWITRESPELDWRNLGLGVKGSTKFFDRVKREMVRTQGTMAGVSLNALLPEGKRSRTSEVDQLEKKLQQVLAPGKVTPQSRPSTPQSTEPPVKPSTPSGPESLTSRKRKAEGKIPEGDEQPEVKRMTREGSMPPFTRLIKVEDFDKYSTIYDSVKKELADALSDCETKVRYKKSLLKGLKHVMHVAFDAIVEKHLLDKTEVGDLDDKTVRSALNTCSKDMEGRKDDYVGGMIAMRRYPFILIPCNKWRAWLTTKNVMTEEVYFNLLAAVLKTAVMECKNWMNYSEQRQICKILGKTVSKGMNLGEIRKELCGQHNIEGESVYCEKQQKAVIVYPTYDEFLDILTKRAQDVEKQKEKEKMEGPKTLSLSELLHGGLDGKEDEEENDSSMED